MESACKRVREIKQTRARNEYTVDLCTKEKKMPREIPATCEIIGVQFTASCPRSCPRFARKKRKEKKREREREHTRAWMCVRQIKRDRKNRLEAYVEIVKSTCNFRQSGSQTEGQLHQTAEKRKSVFLVSLSAARDRRRLFCSLSDTELVHA